MFNARDRQLIHIIPLDDDYRTDRLIWAQEVSGIYSVKSAYKLIQEDKGVWSKEEESLFWKRFWQLKAPPKTKNFIWRAYMDCLPTKFLLQKRRVDVDLLCPSRSQEIETTLHCLVQCPTTQSVWHHTGIGTTNGSSNTFAQWFES